MHYDILFDPLPDYVLIRTKGEMDIKEKEPRRILTVTAMNTIQI